MSSLESGPTPLPSINCHSLLTAAPALIKSLPLPVAKTEPELCLSSLSKNLTDQPAAEGTGDGKAKKGRKPEAAVDSAKPSASGSLDPNIVRNILEQAKTAARASGSSHLRFNLPSTPDIGALGSAEPSIDNDPAAYVVHHLTQFNSQMKSTVSASTGSRNSARTSAKVDATTPAAATTTTAADPAALDWSGKQKVMPSITAEVKVTAKDTKKPKPVAGPIKTSTNPSKPSGTTTEVLSASSPSAEDESLQQLLLSTEKGLEQIDRVTNVTASMLIKQCSDTNDLSPTTLVHLCNRLRAEKAKATPLDIKVCSTDHLCRLPTLLVDEATASQVDALTRALRAMTCVALLAHTSFTPKVFESLPTEVLDSLIEISLRTIRSVQKWSGETVGVMQEIKAEDAIKPGAGRKSVKTTTTAVGKATEGTGSKSLEDAVIPSLVRRQLDALRSIVRDLGVLVVTKPEVLPETFLLRSEEVALGCLLLFQHLPTESGAKTVASYLMTESVRFFAILCRKCDEVRRNSSTSLVQRLRLNKAALIPVVEVAENVQITVATAVMVAATQACCGLPLSTPKVDVPTPTSLVERTHDEVRLWIGTLLQHFFSLEGLQRMEQRDERDVAVELVALFASDCVALLSIPEAPVADHALRTLLFSIVRLHLKAGAPSPSTAPVKSGSGPIQERLRSVAIEIVGQTVISLVRQSNQVKDDSTSMSTDDTKEGREPRRMKKEAEVKRERSSSPQAASSFLRASTQGFEDQLQFWCRKIFIFPTAAVATAGAASAKKGKGAASGQGGKAASVVAPADLPLLDRLLCIIHTSLSRIHRAAAEHHVFSCFDARQYLSAVWAVDPPVSGNWAKDAVKEELKDEAAEKNRPTGTTAAAPATGTRLNFEAAVLYDPAGSASMDDLLSAVTHDSLRELGAQCVLAQGSRRRSMLHPENSDILMSLLLGVFRSSDDGPGWDAARKKGVLCLQQLLDIRPSILPTAWRIIQQSCRDDSARVRETSAILLGSLLEKADRYGAELDGGNGNGKAAMGSEIPKAVEVTQSIISAFLLLIRDRSQAVCIRSIQALGRCMEVLPTLKNADERLSKFVLLKMLSAFADFNTAGEMSKPKQAIALFFAKRWFENIGSSGSRAVEGDVDDVKRGSAKGPAMQPSAPILDSHAASILPELVHLATFDYPVPHEFESDSHPLAQLLRFLVEESAASHHPAATEAALAPGKGDDKTSAASAVKKPRPRTGPLEKELEAVGITSKWVMERVVRLLLASAAARSTSRDSDANDLPCSALLATTHLLASVEPAWLLPKVDSLLPFLSLPKALVEPSAAGASTAAAAPVTEIDASLLLHAVHAVKFVLRASSSLPIEAMIQSLNMILSRYVGPHQQQLLLSCCGALSATIEAGRPRWSGAPPIEAYLRLVYTSMNHYYQRARSALQSITKDERNVGYALRFVFLLSEFIRQYSWEPIATSPILQAVQTGAVPNHLALGLGINENFFQLLTSLMEAVPEASKGRALSIAVRGLASLALQLPTNYLRKGEHLLRHALGASDLSAVIQGVAAIRDFLQEEERRVNAAGKQNIGQLAEKANENKRLAKKDDAVDGATKGEAEGSLDTPKRKSKGPTAAPPQRLSGLAAGMSQRLEVDHNSGMATWLLQRFGSDIMRLSYHPSPQLRALVADTLSLAVFQGLLTPVTYVESLLALSTCEQSTRSKAEKALAYMYDRHEEAIGAGRAVNGVVASFALRVATATAGVGKGADGTAELALYNPAVDRLPCQSFFSDVFNLISKSKRSRESFVLGMLRCLTHEAKLVEWIQKSNQHHPPPALLTEAQLLHDRVNSKRFATQWGGWYLQYLALSLGFLPLAKESDVLLLLDNIRAAVELNGESSLDFLSGEKQKHMELSSARSPGSKKGTESNTKKKPTKEKAGTSPKAEAKEGPQTGTAQWSMPEDEASNRVVQWLKALGLAFSLLLKRFFRKEYGITPAKLLRRLEKSVAASASKLDASVLKDPAAAGSSASLPPREYNSGATVDFLQRLESFRALYQEVLGSAEDYHRIRTEPEARAALEKFETSLNDLIEEDSADSVLTKGSGRTPTTSPAADRGSTAAKQRRLSGATSSRKTNTTTRKRNRKDSDSETDNSDAASETSQSSFPYEDGNTSDSSTDAVIKRKPQPKKGNKSDKRKLHEAPSEKNRK